MKTKIGDSFKNRRIDFNGNTWRIDGAFWKASGNAQGKGELRVYRVHGDITSPDLIPALQLEADTFGAQAVLR